MTETKTICLEETDLKRILAEKFKTDENSISFKLIDPDGYGIHIETKIENVREKEKMFFVLIAGKGWIGVMQNE